MMHLAPFILLCIVSIVGTVGNVFIIAAVCLRKKLRVRGNMFVVNLAVADLIVTGYVMPISFTALYLGYYPFAADVCCSNAVLTEVSCLASVLSSLVIFLERCISANGHQFHRQVFTQISVPVFVGFTWICGVLWVWKGWGWIFIDQKGLVDACGFPFSLYILAYLFITAYIKGGLITMMYYGMYTAPDSHTTKNSIHIGMCDI